MNTLSRAFESILLLAQGSPKDAGAALKDALIAFRSDHDFSKDTIGMMNFVPEYDSSEKIGKKGKKRNRRQIRQ